MDDALRRQSRPLTEAQMFFHSLSSPLSDGFDRVHRNKRSKQQQQQRFYPPAEPPITCCCHCCWRHLRALSSRGGSRRNKFHPSLVLILWSKQKTIRHQAGSDVRLLLNYRAVSRFDLHLLLLLSSSCTSFSSSVCSSSSVCLLSFLEFKKQYPFIILNSLFHEQRVQAH